MTEVAEMSVKLSSRGMEEAEAIRPVLQAFAKRIGQNIEASNPHGHVKSPYEGSEYGLCIYFWSVPESCSRRDSEKIQSVYGYSTNSGQCDAYSIPVDSSIKGDKLLDFSGKTVALIVGKTLYVLFDLPHNDGNRPGIMLDLILEDYYLYLTDRVKFDETMVTRSVKRSFGNFVDLFRSGINVSVDEDLEDVQNHINELRRDLTLAVRNRRLLLEKKKIAEGGKSQWDDDLNILKVYDNLCKLSSTGEIEISEDQITIPVGQIDIEDGGNVYDIGEFKIEIHFDECTPYLRCVNVTRTIDYDYYHPHIGDDGECCFGNASYGIGVLLGDMELETVVLMTIEYLKSYNEDDCMHNIMHWPIKEEKSNEDSSEKG